MLSAIGSRKELSLQDYYGLVSDILEFHAFQQLQSYRHHIRTTRFQHCVNVSYYSYLICRCLHWDICLAARAGLLHDYYFYENSRNHRKVLPENASHFAYHPKQALAKARLDFLLNEKEADSIIHHMWPFAKGKPQWKEGVVVAVVDKCVAVFEFFSFSRKSCAVR